MAKKRDKSKVANGVAKGKKEPKHDEEMEDREPEDVGEDNDGPEPAKKVAKKRTEKKRTKKPAARSSSAEPSRVGGRARKATERYTNPAQAAAGGSPKKRSGSGGQWPVQAIRGIRKTAGNKWEYLVKWQGYKEQENNWEPEANVRNCGEHIKKFMEESLGHTNSLD